MTESTKAPQGKMDALHGQLADTINYMLKPQITTTPAVYDAESGEELAPEKQTVVLPSAAWAAVAAKFLKDNSVFSTPEQDEKMEEMRNALAQRAIKRVPSARDKRDALAVLGASLLDDSQGGLQ